MRLPNNMKMLKPHISGQLAVVRFDDHDDQWKALEAARACAPMKSRNKKCMKEKVFLYNGEDCVLGDFSYAITCWMAQ